MNLFRSEEHVRRWPLYFEAADDYVMPVTDWAEVFSTSMFRHRLDNDYLARSSIYLEDYRQALLAKGKAVPSPDRVLLTVMFTDIVDSTLQAAELGDGAWRELLEEHNRMTITQIGHYGGTVVKGTGDGFMATFTSPTRAIRAAAAIQNEATGLGIRLRAGIHSGECEVVADDLAGIAVHIASRVAAAAETGTVFVSEPVRIAVTGSGIDFNDQGEHTLKGVPGTWRLSSAAI
jgi:class 3 adenylate cyclase